MAFALCSCTALYRNGNLEDNGRTVLFISEGVAMWQRHWQAKRSILMHKHLRHVEYFANPEKLAKSSMRIRAPAVRCQTAGTRKCPTAPKGPKSRQTFTFLSVPLSLACSSPANRAFPFRFP